MIKEFYKKILPSKGIYCIADINPATGKTTHKFVESVDEIEPIVNKLISKNTNILIAKKENIDEADNSKIKKAKELKILILTPEKFEKEYFES